LSSINVCSKIAKPEKCHFPKERLSPCREGLRCTATSKCVKVLPTAAGDAQKKLNPWTKPACMAKCKKNTPCTSSDGFGLQQLTDFSTGLSGNSDPTGSDRTQVFATGACYECKIGPDMHFRCPRMGRRQALMDLLPSQVKNKTELLSQAMSDVLYAGPDVCFDKKLAEEFGTPEDKFEATLVVCNERIELPTSPDGTFKYVGTMAVDANLNAAFVEGFSPTNMDTRWFDFGYNIKIAPSKDGETDRQANFPRSDACEGENGFILPRNQDSTYRKRISDLYASYWRSRNKYVSRIKPCLPAPTMDYREIVSPTTGMIHYGRITFFGMYIVIDDPEIAWKSTRQAFSCTKSSALFSALAAVGVGGGSDAVYCADGEGDMPARLAQLEHPSMSPVTEQKERNTQFDGAVAFVISLMSNYKHMSAMTSPKDKELLKKFEACDSGFWRDLMDKHITDDNIWGVVDEAVFINTAPSKGLAKGEKGKPPIPVQSMAGKLMYGGSLCATYGRRTQCFQYAIPLDVVTATQPLKVGKAQIEAGSFEYYQHQSISAQVFIAGVNPPVTDAEHLLHTGGKCVTTNIDRSVKYYWEKAKMKNALTGQELFANKCPGSKLG